MLLVPGKLRCPCCSFVLQRLAAVPRGVLPSHSKREPCPNGCGPLWPVSWHDEALDVTERFSALFEELRRAHTLIAKLHKDGTVTELRCREALEMDRSTFRAMVEWRIPSK